MSEAAIMHETIVVAAVVSLVASILIAGITAYFQKILGDRNAKIEMNIDIFTEIYIELYKFHIRPSAIDENDRIWLSEVLAKLMIYDKNGQLCEAAEPLFKFLSEAELINKMDTPPCHELLKAVLNLLRYELGLPEFDDKHTFMKHIEEKGGANEQHMEK